MLLHQRPPIDRRHLAVLVTFALLLGCGWSGVARAADPPRLFVVDLSRERLPPPYDDLNLANHVGTSLGAEGCEVERTCRAEECLKESVASSGVHVMTFEVTYDRERYTCAVAVEVRDRAAGRLLYKESSSSPVCPAAELLEHTSRAARVACTELKRTPAAGPPPPAQVVATPAPQAQPDRALSTALIGLGVGALAAGGALLYFDGSLTDCQVNPMREMDCIRKRNTTKVAIPLFLVGALLGGWGSYRLLGPEQRGVQVGLGPQGLLVGGRFQ